MPDHNVSNKSDQTTDHAEQGSQPQEVASQNQAAADATAQQDMKSQHATENTQGNDLSHDLQSNLKNEQNLSNNYQNTWDENQSKDQSQLAQRWEEMSEPAEAELKARYREVNEQAQETKQILDNAAQQLQQRQQQERDSLQVKQTQALDQVRAEDPSQEQALRQVQQQECDQLAQRQQNEQAQLENSYQNLETQLQGARHDVGDARQAAIREDEGAAQEANRRLAERAEALSQIERDAQQQDAQKAAQKAQNTQKAAPGLGESMIKPELRTNLNVDLAVQEHRDKTEYREGSGKDVQSAHMVNSSTVKNLENYVRDSAITVLLPKALHRAFDDYWKNWARERLDEAAPGEDISVTVAEWEKVLNDAAQSVPELRGRTADTMHFLIRTELYQTLGLKPDQKLEPDQKLRLPFSK